jgi:hypothetical protein
LPGEASAGAASPVVTTGTWGTTSTGPAGGRNMSDFADPGKMQDYVSVATKNSQTSGVLAPLVYEARADLNTLFTGPSLVAGGPRLLSLATLQNYARCIPPHAVQATAYVVAAEAFGKDLKPGTPLTVDVTGTDLGLPEVRSGKVTVTPAPVPTRPVSPIGPGGSGNHGPLPVTGSNLMVLGAFGSVLLAMAPK